MRNKDNNPIIESRKKNPFKKLLANLVSRFFKLVLLLTMLFILIIAYAFVLKPKYDRVSTVIAERNKYKQENLIVLENNLSAINRYKNDYSKISPDKLNKINTILPPLQAKEEFFTMFEEMVLKRGYLITNLAVSSDADSKEQGGKKKDKAEATRGSQGPQVGIMNIKADIIGVDYNGLKELLELIENNLRIMDVDNVAYSYSGETLTIDINTYYLK